MKQGNNIISQDCPIKVKIVSVTEWKKGGMWTFLLNLTLVNISSYPRWFLVGRGFNEPFGEEMKIWRVETGLFESQKEVRFVYFYSKPGITSFLLPSNGRIALENWDMTTVYPHVETLYVWQVENIVINGSKSTLYNWLLTDFRCPVSAFVSNANVQIPTHFHTIETEEEGKVHFFGIEKKWAIPLCDPRIG